MKHKITQEHYCLFLVIVYLLAACAQRQDKQDGNKNQKYIALAEDKIFPHTQGFSTPEVHGLYVLKKGSSSCMVAACHGGKGKITCAKCHVEEANKEIHKANHSEKFIAGGKDDCLTCHGKFQTQEGFQEFCYSCHHSFDTYAEYEKKIRHGVFVLKEKKDSCITCHGSFTSEPENKNHFFSISCSRCHAVPSDSLAKHRERHTAFKDSPDKCRICHTKSNEKNFCDTCHADHHFFTKKDAPKDQFQGMDERYRHSLFVLSSDTYFTSKKEKCGVCHGSNFENNCTTCHASFSHGKTEHREKHREGAKNDIKKCLACHTKKDSVNPNNTGCHVCHIKDDLTAETHGKIVKENPERLETCKTCHNEHASQNLCVSCHHEFMNVVQKEPAADTIDFAKLEAIPSKIHGAFVIKNPNEISRCTQCHNLEDTNVLCTSCHSSEEIKGYLKDPSSIGHMDDHNLIFKRYESIPLQTTIKDVCMSCHNKFDSEEALVNDFCSNCHDVNDLLK